MVFREKVNPHQSGRLQDCALGAIVSFAVFTVADLCLFKDAQILSRMADQVRPGRNSLDEKPTLLVLFTIASAGAILAGITGKIMRKLLC